MQHLTTLEDFQAHVLQSERDCVVDFYATWCGPCKTIAPVYEALAEKTPSVTFFKVDVDDANEIAANQGVRAMPTFVFYRGGRPVLSHVGGNKVEFEKKLDAFVAAGAAA